MPESIKNLLLRRADQIASSGERCVSSGESIAFTTKIVVLSCQMIAESRAKIARTGEPGGDSHWALSSVYKR